MTHSEIIIAFLGFIGMSLVVTIIGILVMLWVWSAFRSDWIDTEEWEDEV